MPLLFTIRKRMSEGHKLCVINLAFSAHHAPHFWLPTWGSENDRPRAGNLSPPWLTFLGAGLSLPIAPDINIDELEAAKDTLGADGRRAARAKGAVPRAPPSLSIAVSVGKVSSYLPPQRASASGLCPHTVHSFQAAPSGSAELRLSASETLHFSRQGTLW